MNILKIFYATALLSISVLSSNAQAVPVSLQSLIDGASITSGNMTFEDWTVSGPTADGFGFGVDYDGANIPLLGPDLTLITVDSLADNGNGPGLVFAANGELSVLADDSGLVSYIDLYFGFKATMLDANISIKDNSLALVANGVDFYGNVIIEEIYSDSVGTEFLGDEYVEVSNLDDLPTDGVDITPSSSVWVEKNIIVEALNDLDNLGNPITDSRAEIISFEQRFSQQANAVPEPSTLFLLAAGLIGFSFNNKRRA